MSRFVVDPIAYRKERKKWLTLRISICIGILAVFIGVNLIGSHFDPAAFNFLYVWVPVLIGLYVFTILRGWKSQQKYLRGYAVTISEDRISREEPGMPRFAIHFREMQYIVKAKDGSLMIQGYGKRSIFIPHVIENMDELKRQLSELAPILPARKQKVLWQYRYHIFAPLGFLLFLTMDWTSNLWLGITCGIALMAMCVWRFIDIHRNHFLSDKQRRWKWYIAFLFVLALYTTIRKVYP